MKKGQKIEHIEKNELAKGQSHPQELEEGLRSGPYLLVICKKENCVSQQSDTER